MAIGLTVALTELRQVLKAKLHENVVIRDYLSSKVGGVADYLTVCETVDSLIVAVKAARAAGLGYVVIGQGSNVLFSDVGFAGLVIIDRTSTLSFIAEKSQILAASGVLLARLIMEAASRDLTGLEFLFGLRGTLGGAVVNNRQANGVALGNLVKAVTLLMPDDTIVHYRGAWLDFEPFGSRLMRVRAADPTAVLPVILTVTLQLSRNKKEEILRKIQYFGALNRRNWPLTEPSLGPIFKDPSPEQPAEGFLRGINWSQHRVGRARISARQPNFIITAERGQGPATTGDIASLIELMRREVMAHYGQSLTEAIEYLGAWERPDTLIEYE